jgi:tRNA-splicing endonuclease subunit Sen54
LNVTFNVYKPEAGYKKTDPGLPEFYVSVIDARSSDVPSEPYLDGLLSQTPFHAPGQNQSVHRRLKDGYRNVILAVVDQGIISFLNVSDAGFGLEKIWKREHGGSTKGMGRSPTKSR